LGRRPIIILGAGGVYLPDTPVGAKSSSRFFASYKKNHPADEKDNRNE
jgi:hypothetical protein